MKASIQFNEFTLDLLDRVAAEIWPELAGNRSALNRKVIADWHRMRNETGGGRMARIERLEADMALIKRRLGIGTYDDDGESANTD